MGDASEIAIAGRVPILTSGIIDEGDLNADCRWKGLSFRS